MSNMPELKIGVVAVSRDCFPESLSVTRREVAVLSLLAGELYNWTVLVSVSSGVMWI